MTMLESRFTVEIHVEQFFTVLELLTELEPLEIVELVDDQEIPETVVDFSYTRLLLVFIFLSLVVEVDAVLRDIFYHVDGGVCVKSLVSASIAPVMTV